MVAISATQLFCTKQANSMTVAELKAKTSIDLVAAYELQFQSSSARATPNKPVKPKPTDEITVVNDLNWDGNSFTTSDNPKFAAVNNPDIYVSYCNWFFWEGTPAQMLTCSIATGSGKTFAWNTEWNGLLHTSKYIFK